MLKYLDDVPVTFYGHTIYYSPKMTRAHMVLFNKKTKTNDIIRIFNIDSAIERLKLHYDFDQPREELYANMHMIRYHLKQFSQNLMTVQERRTFNGRSNDINHYDY